MLLAVIDKLFIDLVRDDVELAGEGQLCNLAQRLAAPGAAGRAIRGFRGSGVRYARCRRLDLLGSGPSRVRSRGLWEGRRDAGSR